MPAAAMTATVNRAAGITMALRRHHRRPGGVGVSTGSPYAASRSTDRQTSYRPHTASFLACLPAASCGADTGHAKNTSLSISIPVPRTSICAARYLFLLLDPGLASHMHRIAARHRPDAQAARLCATSTASTPSCGSSPPCAARSASRSSSRLAAKVDELSSGRRPPASRRQQGQLDRRFSELHCLVQSRKFAGSIPLRRTSVCAVQGQ
jgi:hypothetical protein